MASGVENTRSQIAVVQAARAYLQTFARLGPGARSLLLATVCSYTGLGVFGVLFNLYLVALGYNLAFVGLVAAVTTVGQAVISPLVATALRRSGERTTLMAGGALLALTLALSALITNGAGLAVAAALSGAALSVATIPAYPYMMEHASARERSHLFSAYFAAGTVGTMVGSLLSGALPGLAALVLRPRGSAVVVEDRAGLIVGAVIALLSVWLLRGLRDKAPADDEAVHAAHPLDDEVDEGEVQVRPDVLVMLAATGIIALALGATLPFFNVYFAQRLHAGTATIGAIYAASGIVGTLAAFLAPIAGRRGRLHGFSAARGLTAPIFVAFWLHPGLALAAVGYIARNMLGTMSGALENTFAMEVMPARLRGVVASWRSFAFNAAWSLGSLVAGVVVARFGYDVVFVVGGLLTVVGSALYFLRFASRHARKPA